MYPSSLFTCALLLFYGASTSEIYTLPYTTLFRSEGRRGLVRRDVPAGRGRAALPGAGRDQGPGQASAAVDRKSTRLNSSHLVISYAVFCLKKKKKNLSR